MVGESGVEVIGVRQAARITGRTPETVRRWIWSGKLAARKEGNRLLVARADLEAAAGRSAVTGEPPLSLRAWAVLLDEHRLSGEMGATVEGMTAADLVLADRAERD